MLVYTIVQMTWSIDSNIIKANRQLILNLASISLMIQYKLYFIPLSIAHNYLLRLMRTRRLVDFIY